MKFQGQFSQWFVISFTIIILHYIFYFQEFYLYLTCFSTKLLGTVINDLYLKLFSVIW